MTLKKLCSLVLLLSFMVVTQAEAVTFGYTDEATFIKERKAALKNTDDKMEQLAIKLEIAIADFTSRVDKHGSASKETPNMKKLDDGKYEFTYSEIKTDKIQIDISESDSAHADYFAKIRYTEVFYAGKSDSKNHADCEYKRTRSRRVTELARYHKGKWHY